MLRLENDDCLIKKYEITDHTRELNKYVSYISKPNRINYQNRLSNFRFIYLFSLAFGLHSLTFSK